MTSPSHGVLLLPFAPQHLTQRQARGVSYGASDAVPLSPCAGELTEGADPAPAHSAVTEAFPM